MVKEAFNALRSDVIPCGGCGGEEAHLLGTGPPSNRVGGLVCLRESFQSSFLFVTLRCPGKLSDYPKDPTSTI